MSITRGALHRRHLKTNAEGEEGFTLIELLVVLLIIGILLAVAIPTFLSTTKSAAKTAAQANLQIALTGADAYYTQANQTYAGIDEPGNTAASSITAIDTGLTYVSGIATNSTNENVVSLWTDGSSSLVLAAYSPGPKDCWYVIDLKLGSSTVWGGLAAGTYYAVDSGSDANHCVALGVAPPPVAGTLVGPQTGSWPSA